MKIQISSSPTQSEFEEIDLVLVTKRGKEYLIGRSTDADLILDSSDVSRLHAKFFSQAGNYYFCDLGSRNGSIVNGKLTEKNQSYILKDGDIIRIGDFVLVIKEDAPLPQSAETVVRIINPSMFSNWRANENAVSSSVKDERAEVVSEVSLEVPEVSNISVDSPIAIAEEISQIEDELELAQEPTFIQAEDISTPESAIRSPEIVREDEDNDEALDIDTPVAEEVATDTSEIEVSETSEETPEYTIVQPRDIFNQESGSEIETPEAVTEDISEIEAPEAVAEDISEIETPEAVTEDISEIETPEAVAEDISEIETPEAVAEDISEIETPEAVTENEAIISDENVQLESSLAEELEESVVSEEDSILTSELISEAVESVNESLEEFPEPEFQPEEASKEEIFNLPQIINEKQIVLVAHETKKSELADLVAQHQEFLSHCLTITWPSVSKVLEQEAGVKITQEIPPATSGGYQTINSLVNSGDILAVIFIRDFIVPQPGQSNEEALLRICNINQILLATNVPTAEAILHYIKNMKD
ncbi:FHA domain-containing protein [Anabaena subtropica]|uniref:FHA domain-containing protein n=1 Tax=Anabaena subtropica FACHB-260 TaxID=2692884 RepID=A0ABR8CKS6_9NOST|nr:FHA domain-containing protein [Anabaena subtropica]MBD2343807.1 FHA domain-containing protein [Anabaena subtropica FACHB-260]